MGNLEVLSRTQRIVVEQGQSITIINGGPIVQNSSIKVINGGALGPPGVQGPPGEEGPTGPIGPIGPQGPSAAATGIQSSAILVWIINHNLGYYPAGVKFFPLASTDELEPEELTYVNVNRILATWPIPTAGTWMIS